MGIVTGRSSETELALASRSWAGFPAKLLTPREALLMLRPSDVALARLDVRESRDGIEPGLSELERLADSGTTILNPPAALLACHDRLVTARMLRQAGLPHPLTVHLDGRRKVPEIDFPLLLKPRFGRGGEDLVLCRNHHELTQQLEQLSFRPWFRAHGALAQELVRPVGHELRLVVAAGEVVGATAHGVRLPAIPPPVACDLAVRAARALGTHLVGVDLLRTGPGSFCIAQLSCAVDFTAEAGLARDAFQAAASALMRTVLDEQAPVLAAF